MRSLVADGNFKANHLKQKHDETDVWLTTGEGFMTNVDRYNIHLQKAKEFKMVKNLSFLLPICSMSLVRHRPVTVIGPSSILKPVTTPQIVQESEATLVPVMDALHLDPL